MTGRMIVAVAVTVEMGRENARILYTTMLQTFSVSHLGQTQQGIRTNPPVTTSPTSSYIHVSLQHRFHHSQLTTGTRRESVLVDERIFN